MRSARTLSQCRQLTHCGFRTKALPLEQRCTIECASDQPVPSRSRRISAWADAVAVPQVRLDSTGLLLGRRLFDRSGGTQALTGLSGHSHFPDSSCEHQRSHCRPNSAQRRSHTSGVRLDCRLRTAVSRRVCAGGGGGSSHCGGSIDQRKGCACAWLRAIVQPFLPRPRHSGSSARPMRCARACCLRARVTCARVVHAKCDPGLQSGE